MNTLRKTIVATQSKTIPQAALIATYGFNKYQLGDQMRNNFHVADKYLPGLKIYQMRHFTGTEFANALTDGTITIRSVVPNIAQHRYAVIYHNCNPYAVKRAKEVRISLRAAQDEFNLEPYALVEIVDAGVTQ